ncbi:class I SAM-dependent methyltransferase [Bosea sp. CCNWLW174]|uniref:class I SAM-dependent methyltransferase n=1 Tax=unclassified Bosea (in: a-proteobacteria) TaxID=2653178 RepID=UPI003014AB2A
MDHQQTANHWDRHHFDPGFIRAEWSFHPYAKERLHRILGGVASREEWFSRTYLQGRSGLRGLGIGVGLAKTELSLLATGAFEQYDLYDVSPVALAGGKADAERDGIAHLANFVCADVHQVDLAPNSYDVITFIASLHHIADLEPILRKCEAALAPGGIIWAAEYIGPDYFQFPDRDAELAKKFYRIIDPELKKSSMAELAWCTKEELIAVDPTESVNSSKIPDVFNRIFPETTTINTYGSFAFILSWCLNHDALYDTEKGRDFFRTLMDLDTLVIDSGELPHYFAYLIGRKSSSRTVVKKLAERLLPSRGRQRLSVGKKTSSP